MIKEALEYLVRLGNTRIEVVNNQQYSTEPVHLIPEPTANEIPVHSLSGLADYLLSNFDEINQRLVVHVVNPETVQVFSQLNSDAQRNYYITAHASLPIFNFDHFYDTETFNIKLQSAFVPGDDREVILRLVGNIREEQVKNTGDDGIAQTVTASVGVATVATVEVPNPVVLRPYRTFTEVEQPSSEFVFRMQNGPRAALFEADGGAWQHEAMDNIKEFLSGYLEKLVNEEKIVIIA